MTGNGTGTGKGEIGVWAIGSRSCSRSLSLCSVYSQRHNRSICLTLLTRAKCGVRSTLCWKIPNISGSIKLFAL